MHRSGVKGMSRNHRELNARWSHADIGRGLGRVRYAAECYRLLAQDRVRLILDGTIISDEDQPGGQRRIVTRTLTRPFRVRVRTLALAAHMCP
jgi:hypothetical protein